MEEAEEARNLALKRVIGPKPDGSNKEKIKYTKI
jgi:hypothetical protein